MPGGVQPIGNMSKDAAKILVAAGEKSACLKLIGRANFTSSIDFKTVVQELARAGCRYFVIDLSECLLMDSTFLGTLAGLGLTMGGEQQPPDERAIELVNPNARIAELLENLGVMHLFKVTQGPLTPPAALQECGNAGAGASKTEITQACLEAHEQLMALNPANQARFKEVARFLAEDLKRLKGSAR